MRTFRGEEARVLHDYYQNAPYLKFSTGGPIVTQHRSGFFPEDFAQTASIVRHGTEAMRRAILSNNLNIVLAALDAAAGEPVGGPPRAEENGYPYFRIARDNGVPYADVLTYITIMDRRRSLGTTLDCSWFDNEHARVVGSLPLSVMDALRAAHHAETHRQTIAGTAS